MSAQLSAAPELHPQFKCASGLPRRRVRIRDGCIRYRTRGASRDGVDGRSACGCRWGLRRLCDGPQVALRHGQLVRCFARVVRLGEAFRWAVASVRTCTLITSWEMKAMTAYVLASCALARPSDGQSRQ